MQKSGILFDSKIQISVKNTKLNEQLQINKHKFINTVYTYN